MLEILIYLAVAASAGSLLTSPGGPSWTTFNAPYHRTFEPTVIGRYGPSLQKCAAPIEIQHDNPQQTYVYSDCKVSLSAQYVTGMEGKCATVAPCSE